MRRFAHALFGILPAWRHLCDRQLPLWRFHGRRSRLHRRPGGRLPNASLFAIR
jgi:hypothetical protein